MLKIGAVYKICSNFIYSLNESEDMLEHFGPILIMESGNIITILEESIPHPHYKHCKEFKVLWNNKIVYITANPPHTNVYFELIC